MENFYREEDIKSNFVQGEFWKSKLSEIEPGKFYIPLFMFYDDIEVGNTLGSHSGAHKVGAVYFTVPPFPTHVTE